VLQERLFDTLDLRPLDVAPEQSTLRITDFYLTEPEDEPNQYNHQVLFETCTLLALRKCAVSYGVPLEVLLLSAVAGALFRAGVSDSNGRLTGALQCDRTSEELSNRLQLLTLLLYAPMRDGVANETMVGLFSDWREVSLAADGNAGNISVVGLAVHLASLIRSRRWIKGCPLQNLERILVNIVALDERPHGARSLQQTRFHEYKDGPWRNQKKRNWRRGSLRPMRLTLEQYELNCWWLSMDLCDLQFSPAWCRRFICSLERTVRDLIYAPLSPLL